MLVPSGLFRINVRLHHTTSCAQLHCLKDAGVAWFQAGHPHLQIPIPDSCVVPCWGMPPVVWCRGPSASPLCFVTIAWYPTHPSFNHRRLSFYGRRFPTVEHCPAERRVSAVSDCSAGNAWRLIAAVVPPQISCRTHIVTVISDTVIVPLAYIHATVTITDIVGETFCSVCESLYLLLWWLRMSVLYYRSQEKLVVA